MSLVWSDSSISKCPKCGTTVTVGIASLATTCPCGMYYVDVEGLRGWYASREAYERGLAKISTVGGDQK